MRNFILFIFLFTITNAIGQTSPKLTIDSSSHAICGTNPTMVLQKQLKYLANIDTPNQLLFVSQSSFPTALIEHCGSFNIYYEDYLFSPAVGFADPVLGLNRRNTFCAVLNYLESVITIPSGVTLDIHVNQSLSSINLAPANTAWFANAGPYFQSGGFGFVPGFYAGNLFDHINTSIDPDINNYDANLQVNFDKINTTYAVFPIVWWNDYLNTSQSCAFDLYSVLLHEMTHAMGWLSSVGEDNTINHNAICKIANNGYTRFDNLFLYYSNDIASLPFTKVVSNSTIDVDPLINSNTVPLRRSNVWLYNNGAPLNQPVYAGDYTGASSYPIAPLNSGSFMSHLNDAFFSFLFRSQYSPGFQPNYVMAPSIATEMIKREWTLQELRVLNQYGYILKYPFSNSYSNSGIVNASVINNSPPSKTNYNPVTVEVQYTYSTSVFPEKAVTADYTILSNNNTPSNPNTTQLIINLSADPTISDLQSNPISIIPSSLHNIRGCGNGGNNHNCLSLSNLNKTITFTPRPGFRGRALFGFYLTDGIEKGAYKVYSIDVQGVDPTYLSSITTVGSNLIMNPGFEEGTEFKLRVTDESIENFRYQFYREGNYLCGTALSDNHFNNYNSSAYNYAGGTTIGNAWKECNQINAGTKGNFGAGVTDFNSDGYLPLPWPTNPVSSSSSLPNSRYNNLITNQNFSELHKPLQSCHKYRFSGEFNFQQTSLLIGSLYTFTLNFVQPPTYLNPFNGVNLSIPVTLTVTSNGINQWQNFSVDFNYCGNPSSFLNILADLTFLSPFQSPKIDNISIIETPSTSVFSASINSSNSQICYGSCANLSATIVNPFCASTYTWMPGAINTTTLNACPTTSTIYTLTVSDGCSSITTTTLITVIPQPTLSILPSVTNTLCAGQTLTLTASGATTYSWLPSGTGTTNSVVISPPVNTTYTVIGYNICNAQSTKTVVVNVMPNYTLNVVASSTAICTGQSATLTASGGSTYTWQPSGSSANPLVVSPTVTTTYSVNSSNSCGVVSTKTITITVNPLPVITALANPSTICAGQTTTLTASGGTTYTWQPSGSTANPYIPMVSTTTVYTVTGANTQGCIATQTVMINTVPATPILTITSTSSPTICAGITATLTASGASTYSWNTGVTTNTMAITPTITTAYTVTGTSVCGIISTKTIAITVMSSPTISITTPTIPSLCSATGSSSLVTLIATPTPTNATVTWVATAGTLTIPSTQYTVTGNSIKYNLSAYINSTVSINICATASGGSCSTTTCTTIYACCPTPTGVTKYNNYVFPSSTTISSPNAVFGGTITINSGVAVKFSGTNMAIDPNTKFILNGNSTFSLEVVYMHACTAMWDGIYANGTSNLTINKSIIADAKRAVIDSLGNSSFSLVGNYFNKNNKAVHFKAIKTATSTVTFINNLVTCSAITTPTVAPWVNVTASLATATLISAFTPTTMLPPYAGIGSYCGINFEGASRTGAPNNAITIGRSTGEENVFDKLRVGIADVVSSINLQNNVFQNSRATINNNTVNMLTNATGVYVFNPTIFSPPTPVNTTIGGSVALKNTFTNNDYGVINAGRGMLNMTYNRLEQQDNGVYVYANTSNSAVIINSNKFINNKLGINLDQNTAINASINANWMDNPTAQATYADNFAIRTTEANTPVGAVYNVYNNYINGYYNGILSSTTYQTIINDNEVHMRPDPTVWDFQSGIKTFGGTDNRLFNNTVDLPLGSPANFWQMGIFTDQSTAPKVHCNSITNVCYGIAANSFNTTVAGDGYYGNLMQNAAVGFILGANGYLGGDQFYLTTSNSADNAWSNCTNETYAGTGCNTANFKFYTRSASPYNILFPANGGGGAFSLIGVIATSNPLNGTCNQGIATPTLNLRLGGASAQAKMLQQSDDIANGNLTFGIYDVSMKHIARKQLYNNIMINNIDPSITPSVNSFMNNHKNKAIGKFWLIDSLINTNDTAKWALAKIINNNVNTANDVDVTQQQFNTLYLNFISNNRNATISDVQQLETIANLCPNANGLAVHQARTVLFNITHKQYVNTCEITQPANGNRLTAPKADATDGTNIMLYPNPNDGLFTIETNDEQSYQLQVYSLLGELVFEKTVSNKEQINLLHLSSSTYITKIVKDGAVIKTARICIIK